MTALPAPMHGAAKVARSPKSGKSGAAFWRGVFQPMAPIISGRCRIENNSGFIRILGVYLRRRKNSDTIENLSLSICYLSSKPRRYDTPATFRQVMTVG